jgi:hypothetical protein
MKVPRDLFLIGTAFALGGCHAGPADPPLPSPPSAENARVIVAKLKVEAEALRKLDSIALEGTAGLGPAKRSGYQEKANQVAFNYAAQYQKDMGKLIELPRADVEAVFEPLLRAESTKSPNGGIYQTMRLHERVARVNSEPSWWFVALFRHSEPNQPSIIMKPSKQQIVQDYQALRYLASPD